MHLPATVKQYYWGQNGNAFRLSGNYLGVSWFSTKLAVPAAVQAQRVVLRFESVRLRAEVFVDSTLRGVKTGHKADGENVALATLNNSRGNRANCGPAAAPEHAALERGSLILPLAAYAAKNLG